jgi:glutamate-ammonia-ligase adenylyltransferase
MTAAAGGTGGFREALAALPESLPESLRVETARRWEHFVALAGSAGACIPTDPATLQTLLRVWAASDFVARLCEREPQLPQALLDSGVLDTAAEPAGSKTRRLASLVQGIPDEPALMAALRRFRHWELARIAWRDLAGPATLQETLAALTEVADAVLQHALEKLYEWHCQRFGVPRDAQGEAQQLVVLGMGKLGGGELNFSSDIDLIFTFPRKGHTDAPRAFSNEEFFQRLGQRLIKVLSETTADGFAFRVDMRLRPFGDSGPLVMHFDAVEEYYQHHGRDWERYALIKARVCAGDRRLGEQLLARLQPFVYRRYLDYSAFESLRAMKTLISREVERKGMRHNIKLGPGGIREIEFIGQAFQLVYGGREPALRNRGLLPVLSHLGTSGRLPDAAADGLRQAYEFLRRVENRLQAKADQQTHQLPGDPLNQQRLAWSMGYADWPAFSRALERHIQCVIGQFVQVFATAAPAPGGVHLDFAALWSGVTNEEQALAYLAEQGFAQPNDAWRKLSALKEGPTCRALSKRGRERLDNLMPPALATVSAGTAPDVTLDRLLHLLETIARRSVYLALLVEKPQALTQLVNLCAASAWISRYLSRYPLLLDELLDPATLYHPPARSGLGAELSHHLARVPADDTEQVMDALRHFKQIHVLRVAAADVSEAMPLMVVSDHLTEIAEVLLRQVLDLAWASLLPRFGRPLCRVDGEVREARFAIVAYGKLGGIELNYGSDLDLVFLHDSRGEQQSTDGRRPIDNPSFFAKLVQRIIHLLTTRTAAGELYKVDTRLRPSGRAGLLVSSLDAFLEYQRHQAWTWEHQALVRARVVAGPPALAERFAAMRREILGQARDSAALRREVREMRERMRAELGSRDGDAFDLKQDPGGIADIEFMVQYAVLAHAHQYPQLLTYTDNIRQLDGLEQCGVLGAAQAGTLRDAYRGLRRWVHRRTLQEQPGVAPLDAVQDYRVGVLQLWRRIMEESP